MNKPFIFTLTNGLKVLFIKTPGYKTVAIDYRVKAGSNFESKSQIGSAHMIEHLILSKNMEDLTRTGSKVIGVTSRNECLYYIKTLREHFEDTMKYLGKTLINITTSETDIEKEKKVIIQEIKRVLSNPEREIQRRLYATLYPNTRLEKLNTGEIEDIEKLTMKETLDFYEQYYGAKNSILVIVGDLKAPDLRNIVKKYMKDIPKGRKAIVTNMTIEKREKNDLNVKILEKKYPQRHIRISYYGYALHQKERYAMMYLSFIINSYLNEEFRHRRGVVYKINAENFSTENYGFFSIYTSTDSETLYKDIIEKIKDISKEINRVNMDVIKNNLVSDFIFDTEKLSKIASFYSENYLFDNPITIEQEINNIKNVTIKDILRVMSDVQKQVPNVTII